MVIKTLGEGRIIRRLTESRQDRRQRWSQEGAGGDNGKKRPVAESVLRETQLHFGDDQMSQGRRGRRKRWSEGFESEKFGG